MAKVTKKVAAVTYDLTGLTVEQAAVIHALLSSMRHDRKMQGLFEELDAALQDDPEFRACVVVGREGTPGRRLFGYSVQPVRFGNG